MLVVVVTFIHQDQKRASRAPSPFLYLGAVSLTESWEKPVGSVPERTHALSNE